MIKYRFVYGGQNYYFESKSKLYEINLLNWIYPNAKIEAKDSEDNVKFIRRGDIEELCII